MSVWEDLPERAAPMGRQWFGRVSRSINNFDDKLYVILPDLDRKLELGPCRWMPRNGVDLPIVNDDVLVIFDNDREPWVVAWWPYR